MKTNYISDPSLLNEEVMSNSQPDSIADVVLAAANSRVAGIANAALVARPLFSAAAAVAAFTSRDAYGYWLMQHHKQKRKLNISNTGMRSSMPREQQQQQNSIGSAVAAGSNSTLGKH